MEIKTSEILGGLWPGAWYRPKEESKWRPITLSGIAVVTAEELGHYIVQVRDPDGIAVPMLARRICTRVGWPPRTLISLGMEAFIERMLDEHWGLDRWRPNGDPVAQDAVVVEACQRIALSDQLAFELDLETGPHEVPSWGRSDDGDWWLQAGHSARGFTIDEGEPIEALRQALEAL